MKTLSTQHVASTRFSPPRLGAKHVLRVELLARLQQMQHATLALVTGNAGYGKTTLLAQWRQACVKAGTKVAWVSLSVDDTEAADFCSILLSAMQRISLCAEPELSCGEVSPEYTDRAVAAIVESMLALPKDVFVFIDNYHQVEAPPARRFMRNLLESAPGNLHFVIASRAAPRLPLSRLRMTNRLVEVDSARLPFSLAETRAFVAANLGTDKLDEDTLSLVHEMTGGWPSCLQLISTALRTRPVALESVRDLVRHSSELAAYFSEEVIAHLPTELTMFAKTMSIFRRFNAPLACFVTDNVHASGLLKRLEDEHLLISRIDTDDSLAWYHFHPLFGEFLATRFVTAEAVSTNSLHIRGSRWFADHGYVVEAVRHASAGDDLEFAATLIEHTEPADWTAEYLGPMLHLLEKLPQTILFRHQRLLFIACLAVSVTTRPDRAVAWLPQLHPEVLVDNPELSACIPMIHAAIALQCDDTQRMLDLLEPMRNIVIKNPFLRYFRVAELCIAYSAVGCYADVKRQIDLHPIPPVDRTSDMALLTEATWVAALLQQGEIREAERLGTPLLADSLKAIGSLAICTNVCASVLMDAYYELDRIDDARQTVASNRTPLQSLGLDLVIRVSLCRARLDALRGDPDGALAFLDQQTANMCHQWQPRAVAYLVAEKIRLLLQRDMRARAIELDSLLAELAQRHLDDTGSRGEIATVAALAHARVLRQEHPEAALDALLDAHTRAEALGRGRFVALVNFLTASILSSLGRIEEARARFILAIDAGARLGLIRSFVDEGAIAETLLDQAIRENWAQGRTADYAIALFERFSGRLCTCAHAEALPPVDKLKQRSHLTRRERDILLLVAQAMTNKRIALALNLTLETVKWNLRNIFAKLGVSSRYDAMQRARQNGLID
ncbi:LuxR C-terminal-related transcriptional regulator [Burkholderia cepacia]|uniref:LuxR C-terminal-related transcriptional regulator n=1 Tax=Burkholderia cepacia TaxID=292 RepID=UPI002AB6E26B|nr:LuxR C-terminal-related transcriptional regulator [Burkholderia cepacia]